MSVEEPKAILEALLFISGSDGVTLQQAKEALQMTEDETRDLLLDLTADYEREPRGMQIMQIADTFQMTSRPEHATYFAQLKERPSSSTLSQAALEVLAIVAYRQPITRLGIEEIRGVNSDRALQTLQQRGLVQELGKSEGLGRAILYGITRYFLDHFGLESVEQLPVLEEWDDEEEEMLFRE